MDKVHLLFFLIMIVASSGCLHANDSEASSPDSKERALELLEFNDTDMVFYTVKIKNGTEDLPSLRAYADFSPSSGNSYSAVSEYNNLSNGSNGSEEYVHEYDGQRLIVENEEGIEVLNVSRPEHGVKYDKLGSNGTWLYSDFWMYYRPFLRSEFYSTNNTLRPDNSETARLLNGLVATASGKNPDFAAEDIESPEITLRFSEKSSTGPPDSFQLPFKPEFPYPFQQTKRPGVVRANLVTPDRVEIHVQHENPDVKVEIQVWGQY